MLLLGCPRAPISRIAFANSSLWAVFEGACAKRNLVPLWAVFFEHFVHLFARSERIVRLEFAISPLWAVFGECVFVCSSV